MVRLVDSVAYWNAGNGSFSVCSPVSNCVGVFDEMSFTITEPDELVAITTDVLDSINLCFDDCDAQVEVAITGGTQPYNYTLNTNPTVNLGPQSYTINAGYPYYSPAILTINVGDTVTWINDGGNHDVNGDINTQTGLSFNNPQSFQSSATNVVGAIIYTHIFTVSGTYNYDCSIGSHAAAGMVGSIIVNNTPSNTSIDTLTNLCEGNYSLLVSDDNGCSTSPSPNSFSISEPDLLVAGGFPHEYGSSSFNISCTGADDGYMVLIDPSGGLDLTTGGTLPYEYAAD